MKKIIPILVMFCIALFSSSVYGAASISVNRTTVTKGDTITVSASVSGVAAWGINLTSSGPVTYLSGTRSSADTTSNALNGSYTMTSTYRATGTGTATFSLRGDTTDQSGNNANVSTSKSVTIKAPVVTTTTPSTTKPAATTTTNSNANLKKLVTSYEGLTPNFSPRITKYSLAVPATATSLGLTVATEVTGARYSISGNKNLQMGDNTVTITVTATNGTKKVYTILVTKAADATKANAYLGSIIVDGKTLSPDFAAETLEYDIGTVASDVDSLTVLAYAKSEKAKVEITGNNALVAGENIIKIKVTAEDGKTTKQYSIKVTKDAESNATVNIYGEANDIQTKEPSRFEKLVSSIGKYLKKFWLVISLIIICIIEFGQVVYLYRKLNKVNKENKVDEPKIVEQNEIKNIRRRKKVNDLGEPTNEKEEAIEEESKKTVESPENVESTEKNGVEEAKKNDDAEEDEQ